MEEPGEKASESHDGRLEDWKIQGEMQVGLGLGKVRSQDTPVVGARLLGFLWGKACTCWPHSWFSLHPRGI